MCVCVRACVRVCGCVWVCVCVNARASAQPKIFQGKEGRAFVELGHSDKHFIKNTTKSGPAGKHFGVFSPRSF